MTRWRAAIALMALCAPAMAALPVPVAPAAPLTAPAPLTVLRVTPSGQDVPAGRQIVIAFSRPVVPIGLMERKKEELPITLTPDLPCEWRWINTSNLSCNLSEKATLSYATRYTVEVKPGIKAEDGATLAEPYKSDFITERPAVIYKSFHYWKAPGLPVLRLVFNQPVGAGSVKRHMFMLAAGMQRHFFRQPTDSRVALKVYPDPDERGEIAFLPLPGEKYAAFFKVEPRKSDDDARKTGGGEEARRVWLVEPESAVTPDTHIALKVEPGLVSALGPETGISDESVVEFDSFPIFAFLGAKCRGLDGSEITIPPGTQAPEGKCDPLDIIKLVFNTPVHREDAGKALRFTPAVKGWKGAGDEPEGEDSSGDAAADAPTDQAVPAYNRLDYQIKQSHEKGQTYEIWLPTGLHAAQVYHAQSRNTTLGYFTRAWNWMTSLFGRRDTSKLEDVFGRSLASPLDITLLTDHRKPNFVFDHHDAVLEKGVESEVPLFVDNLTKTLFGYDKITVAGAQKGLHYDRGLPASVKDIQYAVPFGVREALGGESGAVYGYIHTEPDTQATEGERRIFAQVTPYAVHMKLGHFSSIAWVTDMASGLPVAGAKVTLYNGLDKGDLSAPKYATATAITDASGIASFAGTDTLDPDLTVTRLYSREDSVLFFLRVEKGKDMALLPLSSDFQINNYRSSGTYMIPSSNKELYGHMRAWGMTAQGIYRAGDTIQYKIYVRGQDNNRFIQPPLKGYRLKIIDSMGKKVSEIKHVTLSEFGSFSGEYTVPKAAVAGWYTFRLTANFDNVEEKQSDDKDAQDAEGAADAAAGENGGDGELENNDIRLHWIPMRVLISDFTPASFKVTGQLNGDRFRAGQDIESTTRAELHSGGPYTNAQARVTALLESKPFLSKHPLAKAFQFDSYQDERDSQQVFQKIDALNDKGELQQHFSMDKPNIVYGSLMVESAVQDDRGKYISGSAHADYVGVDRLVGLHATEWLYTTGKPAELEYLVVDERGNPAAGTPVGILIEHEVTKSARVKSAGNAYLSEYHSEWEKAGECKGVSGKAASICSFTPGQAGSYRATASIQDTKGNAHSTKLGLYALGNNFVVWGDENDTGLTLVPERTDYKIGETARYLVKNPYPGAKALITIERYGVLDRFVQTFTGSTPVVEFPVKPDYLPGFYLSVIVMSPRVDKPIEGQVDLGKPAFRMGYITVPVSDPYKEMLVRAKVEHDVYKPRDKVTVTLHAEPRSKDISAPIEMAVAVLDESVFDLIAQGKDAFDPYKGFYKLESLDLRNYSLLLKLVGRQKFEKKGANPGGDGGHDAGMRSLFKFVSYWNPSVIPDKDGNATVTFDAPDNLTGWRVLALATTPGDRFGLGEANFKVNRPTEVRPVMPNQVTEGDRFNAGFSVMNRTDKPRELKVSITAEGNVKAAKPFAQTVKLGPYKRTTVFLPLDVTPVAIERDIAQGKITFRVKAGDAVDSDGLIHMLPVNKQRSLEVAANYATTTEPHAQESIQFPPRILPDVGSVSVVTSPSVIASVTGAFRYLKDYPYLCWEQQLTKGVMAAHFKQLNAYLPKSFTWNGSDAIPQRTLNNASSFQAPNGGMTYFTAEDRYVDPYLSAYTAIAFNWLRKDGYEVPETVETKLHAYLKNLLRNDAMPDFYSEGMSSSVRAVALAALADDKDITAVDIARYAPHVPKMSLFGKAHFMEAAMAKDSSPEVESTVEKILAASNETGGKFIFSETLDDGYLRILASPLRDNCAILDSFTRYAQTPHGKTQLGDVPFKLVRMITQARKSRDHWENTQENVFCMNALIDYARVYEKETPDMTVTAKLDDKPFGSTVFKTLRDEPVTLERPIDAKDIGRKALMSLDKAGSGRLYYSTRLTYALPPNETHPENAGIEVHREYSVERGGKWELLKNPMAITRGELVRVDLYLSVPAARNFVVMDDPVPGGLEPVNSELATASKVDADKGAFNAAGGAWWFHYGDWMDYGVSRWSFYHKELRDNAARFYSDYLPAGNYHLSYTAQAIATGHFTVMPSMAQEMYDPDVYGKTETLLLDVGEPLKP